MPSKVHDNLDILDKPVALSTKDKPTDSKTLHDRINESNQHGPAAKGLLRYEANKLGIKKTTAKGGRRNKNRLKYKKSLKRRKMS